MAQRKTKTTPQPLDAEWLDTQLRTMGGNRSRLAAKLGIDRSGMSRMLKGERRLRLDEVPVIARYIELSPEVVLEWAGLDVAGGAAGGFEEMKQSEFVRKSQYTPIPKETNVKPKRHPAWGALKGTTIVMPGVDLTEPTAPEWGQLDE